MALVRPEAEEEGDDRLNGRTGGRVVITGAAGFVGNHVVERFLRDGWNVVALVRPGGSAPRPQEAVQIVERDLTRKDALVDVLRGGDVVVHLAGRAHVMHERASNPLAAFRAANVAPDRDALRSRGRGPVLAPVGFMPAPRRCSAEGRERTVRQSRSDAPAEAVLAQSEGRMPEGVVAHAG
jgi:uncharacterized protein YbjT (DUF2867 family)